MPLNIIDIEQNLIIFTTRWRCLLCVFALGVLKLPHWRMYVIRYVIFWSNIFFYGLIMKPGEDTRYYLHAKIHTHVMHFPLCSEKDQTPQPINIVTLKMVEYCFDLKHCRALVPSIIEKPTLVFPEHWCLKPNKPQLQHDVRGMFLFHVLEDITQYTLAK